MSKFQKSSAKNVGNPLLRLTTTAMMIALSVIFTRLLGFPSTGMWRVEIGFFPIAIVAILYGPLWSATAYGLADLIGSLLTTGMNPFILICKIVFGLLMGIFFYKREKIGLLRNILFFLFVAFIVDIVMMTPIFVYVFGNPWDAAIIMRLAAFAVNTPVRIILMAFVDRFLLPAIYKYIGKKENLNNGSNG
ncbi:MAG: folate family ECF transporter S component [Clostridia bacterium]|nr:folate family ECF transporter S component [Clostridia bacterium]